MKKRIGRGLKRDKSPPPGRIIIYKGNSLTHTVIQEKKLMLKNNNTVSFKYMGHLTSIYLSLLSITAC